MNRIDIKKIEDHRYLILALLNLGTLALYWPINGFNFVNLDDPEYVMANPMVANGITLNGILSAFSTGQAANWHPLTWLSHMLDCQLFGMRPGLHHLTNVWLHMANSVMLFLILERMTAAKKVSVPAIVEFCLDCPGYSCQDRSRGAQTASAIFRCDLSCDEPGR